MNYFIDVAASAQRDLADAFDYIDLTLKNPSAADKLVAIAWKKFRSLDTFPQRFSLVNDPFLSSLGIRLIVPLLSSLPRWYAAGQRSPEYWGCWWPA